MSSSRRQSPATDGHKIIGNSSSKMHTPSNGMNSNSAAKKRKKFSRTQKKKSKTEEKDKKEECGKDSGDLQVTKDMIQNFVTRTFHLGINGLKSEFAEMKRFNDWSQMTAFCEEQNKPKNRYKDVGCLDAFRVTLKNSHNNWPNEYIHANYVHTPKYLKRFICCQAPLDNTCADFWYMCLADNVQSIIMLCNLKEKNMNKCSQYFPTSSNRVLTFEEQGEKVTVTLEDVAPMSFPFETKTRVILSKIRVHWRNQDATIKHFNWNDWPDRGVPAADLAVLHVLKQANSHTPIVVHCSAGIGRTGSVVMIQYIYDTLALKKEIEEPNKILQNIRRCRNNSVQSDYQYIFVHAVVLNYLDSLGVIRGSVHTLLNRFREEYANYMVVG